ncbi:MAG: elongation factor G [Bacteroidales bacterium]|nr:elongation factor G [Bacteroidales bacterium]MBN2698128.1 elongation factor G [Bacteroidales bacterium]
MKTYSTDRIKNVALVGNAGSGKTTLVEAMLYEGGIIDRRGDISSKNTVSDYNPIEQENETSMFSSIMYTEYDGTKINILDVPGADDFVGGTISSLHVADTGIMIVNAQNGVEVGTEIHSRWLNKFDKPVMIVINKCDHDHANFEKTLESIKDSFGGNAVLAQYPVNTGPGFDALVDIIQMKYYKFPTDGGKPEITEIPAEEKARAEELRNELIEKAAENDEALMELFFENDTLSEEEMRKGITMGVINRGMFPIFCISAKKNYGVNRLMEFIANVIPAPNELKPALTTDGKEIVCDSSKSTSLFVFKTSVESHIGEINFFKIMSGELKEGMDLTNTSTQNKERFSQIFAPLGKNRTKTPSMAAGDIGCTVKLKNTRTNQTLCSPDLNIKFPPVPFPEPKYRTAIKPESEGDEEKLGEALGRLHLEDPTILVEYSKELRQIILSGQGEYHLQIAKWHLDNVFKVSTSFITPKIPYRETITKAAQADYRHKKQSGGAGQFGEVHMIIEPIVEGSAPKTMFKFNGKDYKISVRGQEEHKLPWGGKLEFLNCIVGGSIDARFLPAILKGIMEKLEEGPLTGSYARDIRVYVYDGKMHPVDSNEISFMLAGRNAFSQAFKIAGPKIMEPIYDVEVLVPSDRMGDVMSDLQGRRAIVQGMSSEKGFEKILAKVPLAEMNKYSTALSSLTNGRAIYSMKFAEYTQVPGEIQEELLKAYEDENEDN